MNHNYCFEFEDIILKPLLYSDIEELRRIRKRLLCYLAWQPFYVHGCGGEGCGISCPHPARRAGEDESSLPDLCGKENYAGSGYKGSGTCTRRYRR